MSDSVQEKLHELYTKHFGIAPDKVVFLTQAGSDRKYYRIYHGDKTVIGTHNPNPAENKAFINFTTHFSLQGLPVPELYATDMDEGIYLQKDLGDTSLFGLLQEPGGAEKYSDFLKKSLSELAQFQLRGDNGFDYEWTYSGRSFDHYGIVSDLNYWKYYFIRPLNMSFDGYALDNDFNTLATWLTQSPWQYFMFRDFQSRNIMVKDEKLYFIDYQGGRKGPALYDCASFLWQARSNISYGQKEELAKYFIEEFKIELTALYPGVDAVTETTETAQASSLELLYKDPGVDAVTDNILMEYYRGFVLLRLLQVLGAYGYRGLFERKQHFISSIPHALENLAWWMENYSLPVELPELQKVLRLSLEPAVVQKFSAYKKTGHSRLTVTINSFSFKQQFPVDESGNGGGFTFDCRFIDNPGRKEEYKALTGLDEPVKAYLGQTTMPGFLERVFAMVDEAVENYLERDFEHLMVNFGCTGGQHRSVFAAEAMATHLKERYPVKVIVRHIEQEKKKLLS